MSTTNVVFDFGGVLFRWQPHEIIAAVLPAHAATRAAADEWVGSIFQGFGGDWAEFDRGVITPGPLAERIARRTGLSAAQARAVIDAVPDALVPIEGTVRLLERLHGRGVALYFLSNMPEPYARHLQAGHSFLRWFRGGVFSHAVKLIKPEPELFAHAARHFGVAARNTLLIDDLGANVQAARAAGWAALHYRDPLKLESELRELGLL